MIDESRLSTGRNKLMSYLVCQLTFILHSSEIIHIQNGEVSDKAAGLSSSCPDNIMFDISYSLIRYTVDISKILHTD